MAAIAVRADQLKLITEYRKIFLDGNGGRLGYRKREPNEPPREEARLLKAMVGYHTNKLGYSIDDMAKLLHLLPAEFERMYAPEVFRVPEGKRQHLRIIK